MFKQTSVTYDDYLWDDTDIVWFRSGHFNLKYDVELYFKAFTVSTFPIYYSSPSVYNVATYFDTYNYSYIYTAVKVIDGRFLEINIKLGLLVFLEYYI